MSGRNANSSQGKASRVGRRARLLTHRYANRANGAQGVRVRDLVRVEPRMPRLRKDPTKRQTLSVRPPTASLLFY